MKELQFKIHKNFKSVYHFLKTENFSERSITLLRKKYGLIKINGNDAKTISPLEVDDLLIICLEEHITSEILAYDLPIKIVFENDDFLVLDKPHGLPVIETIKYYGKSLSNVLAHVYGENFIYRPVNRLDKDTSGLMIVAKNAFSHHQLMLQMKDDLMIKHYLAITKKGLPKEGEINLPIANSLLKRYVSKDGKMALTKYIIHKETEMFSLVKIRLMTGRTHQIRVHFSHLGFPLIGDDLYGGDDTLIKRQALHAFHLSFLDINSKKRLEFFSDLPLDMENLLKIKNEQTKL